MDQMIWVVSFKVEITEGSPADYGNAGLFYGETLVPTGTEEDARMQTIALLESCELDLHSIDQCQIYREQDWSDDEEASVYVSDAVIQVNFSNKIYLCTLRAVED